MMTNSFLLSMLLALVASVAHVNVVDAKPVTQAPAVTTSVYEEALPMLFGK